MAVKVVEVEDKLFIKRIYRECELIKTLTHPNIVKYLGCVMNEEKKQA
jgi:hypothetical protein